jgi:hypothetical protein
MTRYSGLMLAYMYVPVHVILPQNSLKAMKWFVTRRCCDHTSSHRRLSPCSLEALHSTDTQYIERFRQHLTPKTGNRST